MHTITLVFLPIYKTEQEQNVYIQGSKQCDKCAYYDASLLGLTVIAGFLQTVKSSPPHRF
jgi:hypothetical protein